MSDDYGFILSTYTFWVVDAVSALRKIVDWFVSLTWRKKGWVRTYTLIYTVCIGVQQERSSYTCLDFSASWFIQYFQWKLPTFNYSICRMLFFFRCSCIVAKYSFIKMQFFEWNSCRKEYIRHTFFSIGIPMSRSVYLWFYWKGSIYILQTRRLREGTWAYVLINLWIAPTDSKPVPHS